MKNLICVGLFLLLAFEYAQGSPLGPLTFGSSSKSEVISFHGKWSGIGIIDSSKLTHPNELPLNAVCQVEIELKQTENELEFITSKITLPKEPTYSWFNAETVRFIPQVNVSLDAEAEFQDIYYNTSFKLDTTSFSNKAILRAPESKIGQLVISGGHGEIDLNTSGLIFYTNIAYKGINSKDPSEVSMWITEMSLNVRKDGEDLVGYIEYILNGADTLHPAVLARCDNFRLRKRDY